MSKDNTLEPWADTGIPGHGSIDRLLYNRPSDTLVVVQHKMQVGVSLCRLYYRSVTDVAYQDVPVETRWESQEDAACCETTPLLIYNAMRLRPSKPGSPGSAADWDCVRGFDLATGVTQRILDRQSLRAPPPYTCGWVSSIITMWPDGLGAVCRVGLERRDRSGEIVVEYFVYDVSFQEGLRRRIANLPGVFL